MAGRRTHPASHEQLAAKLCGRIVEGELLAAQVVDRRVALQVEEQVVGETDLPRFLLEHRTWNSISSEQEARALDRIGPSQACPTPPISPAIKIEPFAPKRAPSLWDSPSTREAPVRLLFFKSHTARHSLHFPYRPPQTHSLGLNPVSSAGMGVRSHGFTTGGPQEPLQKPKPRGFLCVVVWKPQGTIFMVTRCPSARCV